MIEDIRKILGSATLAPSGENAQPWKFVVKGNTIFQFNVPHRDQSLYSWGQRASYISNGAALENIVIASKELGYNPNIELFPDSDNEHFIAKISLVKDKVNKDPLYEYIPERSTNRKPYEIKLLDKNEEKELLSSINDENTVLHFTQDIKKKKLLGRVGSTNERVMLSNKHLHNFFFSHVNWSKEEDDKKKIGFFIDTLELPPPALLGFKVIKNWVIMNLFSKIGFHKVIGLQNAKINSASSGFGVITVNNNSPKNFVNAGRSMQRLWLTATKLKLSMQPLTGIIFFMYRVMANDTEKFSKKQVHLIKKAYSDIQKSFNLDINNTVAFMFRIGYGGKPSARSTRFSIDEVTEFQ
jgi:hypothetical protein